MEPVRTCVGCRQRDLFKNLIRVVKIADSLQISATSRGRGAWVHQVCIPKAIERKGFQRALGDANLAELEAWQTKQAEKNAGIQMSSSK
ncbi:MAG: hypothetical protein RL718_502 [Actinomycetota bacterium]|jgi:predicted RNA-binding protein YlxR (DUF448 family)